jgi:tetratricopeptide (TPR) repeat protein
MLAESSLESERRLRVAWQKNPFHFRAKRTWLTVLVSLGRIDEASEQLPTAQQMMPGDSALAFLDAMIRAARNEDVDIDVLMSNLPQTVVEEHVRGTLDSIRFVTQSIPPDVDRVTEYWPELAQRADQWFAEQATSVRAAGLHLPPRLCSRFGKLMPQLTGPVGTLPVSVHDTLNEIVEVHPEGSLLTLLGDIYLSRREIPEALECFDKATRTNSLVQSAHRYAAKGVVATSLHLGLVLNQDREVNLQRFLLAARTLEPESALEPSHCNAIVAGALEAGDLELARRFIGRWHELVGDKPGTQLFWNELILAQREDNLVEVVSAAGRVLQSDPHHQAAKDAKADALRRIQQSIAPQSAPE